MIQICEQVDGYRVADDSCRTNTVMYFKKTAGWTLPLVEEMRYVLQDSYEMGYAQGKEDVGY